MKIGVLISTYNKPRWLEKCFWGYMAQERKADEIVVADDGSGPETAELIEKYKQWLPLKHVWHEDKGYRKTKILNKAILASESEYLVFTDHDCIPRKDFLAVHEQYAQDGFFLSGGYFKLPKDISLSITADDVSSQRAFRLSWLRSKGLQWNFKCTKLIQNSGFEKFMNHITPTHATWNGMNSSGWRRDIIAAKGFDERMQYGGLDRELGERLFNAGIRSKQIRYSAIVLHLFHNRPYSSEETWKKNNAIRRETREQHLTETAYGL